MPIHVTRYYAITDNEHNGGVPIQKLVTDLADLRKELIIKHDCDNVDFEFTQYPEQ